MKLLLDDLREEFDYILIDSPAGIDEGFRLATFDANHIVVVTTPQIAAIHDADCVLQLLRRQKFERVSLLVNCFRRQMVRDGNMLDLPDISELLEADLLGVVLEDEEVIVCQNHGEPVFGHHTISESCYQHIAQRLNGEEVDIPDYIRRKKLFSKVLWGKNARKLV